MKSQGYNLVLKFFMAGDYEKVCYLFYSSFPFSCSPFLPLPLCLCSPGWPGTDLVVQAGLKLLIFSPWPLQFKDSRNEPPNSSMWLLLTSYGSLLKKVQ